ncbi:ATP-binding cassette domain-containing protein [Fodinicola acaciae]|uniref:ATP-binding cassette domain-containing protein n=1 Tax=Fodinicola acaciae TaxID=2681555 RepID=UPI0013D4F69A|nr:excinuclease ABC subunit UvrA [Fodinicola acaciae]
MTEHIVVRGARENNLRDISLAIPKRKLTVFVGVSGSGKSSLVFDTVAAEAQRQLNETFTPFVRTFLPKLGQPDADLIDNVSTAVIVDQKRLGGNSRSTVGTVTDINPLLRLMFSRAGKPYAGHANAFSFNDPTGMCPDCHGIGRKVEVDEAAFFDRSKSLNDGALLHPSYAVGGWYWKTYAESGLFDNDRRLADYSPEEWQTLLYGADAKVRLRTPSGVSVSSAFEGVITKFTRLAINREDGGDSSAKRENLEKFTVTRTCLSCEGRRLNENALSSRIGGRTIADLTALDLVALDERLQKTDAPPPLIESARGRLGQLISMGLGYLTLDRETSSLSGGESQRIKMVRHLGSSLTDVMYVLDEPSIGLHPRDVRRLTDLLLALRDKGNTVLVVEHDPDVIRIADHVVEIGPGAGADGGEIVFEGSVDALRRSGSLTGKHLDRKPTLRTRPRKPSGHLRIANADAHNLKSITVDLPLGVLAVVSGVAGAGKSSLIRDVLVPRHPGLVFVDQSAVTTSIRSTPATYTGVMDPVRRLFARTNKVSPGLFSFNSAGACDTCQGLGVTYTDLAFMDGVRSVCETCGGRRYTDEVLAYTVNGLSISDVLDLTAAQAVDALEGKDIRRRLRAVVDVGLGYLTLGQPLSTLSGGECQRIKLATQLHRDGTVFVLDEPTTGLHMSDCGHLLALLDQIVDGGGSVIVIEHNLDVIAYADWVLDLGPDGGDQGGAVVYSGPPAGLVEQVGSHTGAHLRRHLS